MLLCFALPFAPTLAQLIALQNAQAKWARAGGRSYTAIVSQTCQCAANGEYRLTVVNGQVMAVEALSQIFYTPSPLLMQDLTAEASFTHARQAILQNWSAPWNRTLEIRYDQADGHILWLRVDSGGLLTGPKEIFSDTAQIYGLRDIQLTER